MVEINLEAIVLADSPAYLTPDVITVAYNPAIPVDPDTKFPHGQSEAYYDNLEDQYGIRYKYLWGYNSSGQYTQGYIVSWDATYLYVYAWSNSRPYITSTIKLRIVTPIPYIGSSATQTLPVGDNLIEGTLVIKQQFESLKKMDLRVSSASFEIIESDDINTFMGKYWTAERYNEYLHAIGVHIKIDGVGKFWGYMKPENVIYDPEAGVYSIDAFDWVKFILETKGQNYLPDYSSPNIYDFLEDNMFLFNELDVYVSFEGMPSFYWIKQDYNYILEDGVLVSIEHLMTVEDMFVEMMKYYGAYMYYDGDKNLVFRSRNINNTPANNAIDDYIISGTFSKSYVLKDYDSLLINAKETTIGDWNPENAGTVVWEGWVLIWWGETELQSLVVNADLSNIPVERKYLDLRQKIPYESFAYRLFYPRSKENVYSEYAYLLKDSYQYTAELVRDDLSLADLVTNEGYEYIIRDIEITDKNKSTVILERKIG